MRRSLCVKPGSTEHQIIAVLKPVEAGRTVKDVCRETAISEACYYNWKVTYGWMEAVDIKKIKMDR
jgi:putative transposase